METNIKGKNTIRSVKKLEEKAEISFWQSKTAEELAKEQRIKPIKDAKDLSRITGGLEDWDDVDEFLKEIRRA
jgi:hypothetical protein